MAGAADTPNHFGTNTAPDRYEGQIVTTRKCVAKRAGNIGQDLRGVEDEIALIVSDGDYRRSFTNQE